MVLHLKKPNLYWCSLYIPSVLYIGATVDEIYFRKVFITIFTHCIVNLTVANASAAQ
jgi:hypothetical protein